ADKFVLHSGADVLKDYRFNTHKIRHMFCPECGIEPFASGTDAKGNDIYMVNVNCLEDVPEIDRAAIKHWNGKDW
ncbi:MAG: GFA family protein, partial [Novosphingobium sp.]